MYDIISVGSATRDVFFSADELKKFKMGEFPTGEAICFGYGSKIEMKKIVLASGGGGTNAAVTFARQGLKTANIGVVGADINGQEILRELASEGINVDYFLKHDDDYTAYSVILVHADGERTILSYKGEGQHFDVTKIPFQKLKSKWAFIDSLGGHFDVLEGISKWGSDNNIKLATNPGGKELAHGLEKLRPILKNFSIVIMNQEEAAGLTGIDYKKEADMFKFMDEVIDGVFVMTKGPDGVVVSDLAKRLLALEPLSVNNIDGVKLSFEDGWLLIRASGTEPKIRITAEARSERRAHWLYDSGVRVIKECRKEDKEE